MTYFLPENTITKSKKTHPNAMIIHIALMLPFLTLQDASKLSLQEPL